MNKLQDALQDKLAGAGLGNDAASVAAKLIADAEKRRDAECVYFQRRCYNAGRGDYARRRATGNRSKPEPVDGADAGESLHAPSTGRKMMGRVKDLQAKAGTLRKLLEQHAPYDADVKEAYEWIKPLLDAVDAGAVIRPTKFPFGWIFFRGENNLPAYPALCGAAAEFADALEANDFD